MLPKDLSLSFLILSFMFSLLSVSTANSNVYVQCSQLNFTSTTPYESNVNSLFTSLDYLQCIFNTLVLRRCLRTPVALEIVLLDSASIYNFNKIETSPQSNSVYGVFQCRGDLSSPNCKDCVASSISQLKTACPMSKGGEIQLERCFVKYDDTSFFGAQDKTEVYRRCGPSNGYNSDVSNRIDSALANLVGENEQYFRGGDFGSVQGVAQCVQDLSLSDCQDCLSEASGRLRSECESSTWGDMYLGKCYIRYDAEQGNLNTPDDNSNSNSNKSSDKRRKKNKRWRNFGINVASFFGGALAFSLTVVAVCACNCCNTTNSTLLIYLNFVKIMPQYFYKDL
ncbi:putative Gnk2-like domain-containing protein [Helianthus annuus]|uniref:Gnk2-like domain-containing protein n=2 Tax=Helianthus annuus TaxID=4232 RepID=A0A9K3HF87_HELAN|nr:putative Gnk2-like domain-containing protein [Helianthus annuus]KAJ0488810.1 putative Gnk2-like domain-containing protein [Helianthus annuus]KAJ0504653.1 putative Gnk2-like domain-containing protein [Helianthus annuus]KAJ0674382.1 putative Gnk2-like domain-containing protein [Helianthus annuus]KAJ0959459.1 putative Gnk2-like domain-containing protein [Helianthus annuus]